jgi:hypothetical protein
MCRGMLSDALDQLERDLAVELPDDFRGALAEPAIHEAFRSAMLDANPTLRDDDAVADTAAVLRENNLNFRKSVRWIAWDDGPPSDEAEKPWPHVWIWVGGNYCGDAYFLDLSRNPAPVAFWSHEALTCRVDKPLTSRRGPTPSVHTARSVCGRSRHRYHGIPPVRSAAQN